MVIQELCLQAREGRHDLSLPQQNQSMPQPHQRRAYRTCDFSHRGFLLVRVVGVGEGVSGLFCPRHASTVLNGGLLGDVCSAPIMRVVGLQTSYRRLCSNKVDVTMTGRRVRQLWGLNSYT
jgi:hypothetical protein